MPVWDAEDSARRLPNLSSETHDVIFTCPPYGDLEVYSDDPSDLSAMPHWEFMETYRFIVEESARCLKEDRFAVMVVSDFRAPDGNYRGFVGETVSAFERAGMVLYNDAVLINAVGSLAIRAGRMFSGKRKLGRGHQNVLVFLKGDATRATEACGEIEVALPDELTVLQDPLGSC